MNTISYQPEQKKHWQAFFYTLITAAVIFLPFVLYNRGYFIYIGDFNVQQIPFYKLAHEAVRSGDIFWSWYTDLGANFIGSYSFYLTFSPFFWLTLPFPTSFVPHLMAPLLVLKTACAALTSYFYIQRFVRNKDYAVIGAMLYAFSGFTMYNVFFNHFHEVIVFFPLMLIGLEELLVNNRKGAFAVAVAVNAIVNYWFFVGEVVFVVLYYFLRCTGLKGAIRKLGWVALEGVLGCLCAAFALLPSALAVLGNPRTTLPENMLDGWQFWLYTHEQRQPGILSSFFFPPETPSRPNMFPDHGAKWASLSAWLPLFSMSGVLGFLISVRKNWLRKLIILLAVIAMVPGLNSLFIALNHSYYTRWFYMLVLLLCVATAVSLDNERIDLLRGFRWTLIVTLCIAVPLAFTPVFDGADLERIGLAKDMDSFWVYAAVALVGLCLCYLLLVFARRRPNFTRILTLSLAVFCACYSILYLAMSKSSRDNDNHIIDNGIQGREHITLPDPEADFYRMDIPSSGENMGMYWHIPNIQAFHSVVPVSIMEFYPEVGVKRDVSSRPEPEFYALRSLLSVRYLFLEQDEEDQEPMPGYRLHSQQLDYYVYENENYLPMGFAFDTYIDEADFSRIPMEDRHLALMHSIYLTDEQIARHHDLMDHAMVSDATEYDYDRFLEDVEARRGMSCSSFQRDNRGFTATANLAKEALMFFSVPYEAGWSATVNGQPARIEQVDIGFMAVRVPAGESTIRFDYMTPGLIPGLLVSGGAWAVLIAYGLVSRNRRRRAQRTHPYRLFDEELVLDEDLDDGVLLEECLEADGEPGTPRREEPEVDPDSVQWSEEDFTGGESRDKSRARRRKKK